MTSGQIPEKPKNDDDRKRNPDQPHDQTTAHDNASQAGEAGETRLASLGSMAAPALDEKGLEAAIRECARITAPEVTDEIFVREREGDTERYRNTRNEMSQVIAAYLSALPLEPVAWRYQFRPGDVWTLSETRPSDKAIPPATGRVEPLYALASRPAGRVAAVEAELAWDALDRIVKRADPAVLSPIQYEAAEVAAKIARQALDQRGEVRAVDFPAHLFPALVPAQPAGGEVAAALWPIDTDDQVEALAKECGINNRRFMTPADYSIWCEQQRKFARLSVAALVPPASALDGDAVREALKAIKTRVIGDRVPHWTSDAEVIRSRLWIADICDAALSPDLDPAAAEPETHGFEPHAKYPWFCARCGYARHEALQHADALDDDDRTPKPENARDIPDRIWEIADRAFFEGSLVADDGKCVEIFARSILTALPPASSPTMDEVAEVLEPFAQSFDGLNAFEFCMKIEPHVNTVRALLSRIKGGA